MGTEKQVTRNNFEGGIAPKEDYDFYMVGFQGYYLLRAIITLQNN